MGFWDILGKMIQGKPVFENQPGSDGQFASTDHEVHMADTPATRPDTSHTPVDSHGQKIIPEISLNHVECHANGDHLEVWVIVHNRSNTRVFVDKIMMLGRTTDLDYDLGPGAERQLRVYNGPKLRSDSYHYADVNYRVHETGDYFQARFYVEYDYEHDGTYQPNDFNLQHPIRDI